MKQTFEHQNIILYPYPCSVIPEPDSVVKFISFKFLKVWNIFRPVKILGIIKNKLFNNFSLI